MTLQRQNGCFTLAALVLVATLPFATAARADSATQHGTFNIAEKTNPGTPIYHNYTRTSLTVVATVCVEHGGPVLLESIGASFTVVEPCETFSLYVTPQSGITLRSKAPRSSGTYQVSVSLVPEPSP